MLKFFFDLVDGKTIDDKKGLAAEREGSARLRRHVVGATARLIAS